MKRMKSVSSLKARTTIYTILLVVISYCLICSVLFFYLFNSQQAAAKAEFQDIVRKHTGTFEKRINDAIEYLSFVTTILEFQVRENETNRESLQKLLHSLFQQHPAINSSSIYFEPDKYDGRDAEFLDTQYGSVLSGRISFAFYRLNGTIYYMPQTLENDMEFIQPYYLTTKETNAPFYTEPVVYSIDGLDTLMIVIVNPIRNQNHEFIGAITADIHLGDIYNQLQEEKIYDTGYMIIANDSGMVIYSPIFEDVGKIIGDAGLTYHQLHTDNNETTFLNTVSIFNGRRALMAVNVIHVHQLDSYFSISVTAPLNEINANGTRLMFIVITFSFIIAAIITILLYYLINRLMMPVMTFVKSAEKLGQGNYSTRITGEYDSEFNILKDTVNLMAERIETNIKDSKKSLEVLKNILNGIDAFIYVTIPDTGEVLFVNEPMRKMFNLKGEEGVGEFCYKLFRNLDDKCSFCPCHELDKDPDKIITWEEPVLELGRDIRHTDCYIDWMGGVKVHLQHAIDVTDIKRITLGKLKAEREAQEYSRKKEQAEETSRMKSVFLASMSHEIRTPMHGIIGFSELALDDNIPQKTRDYLGKIKASSESLLLIINDILDVSKIEAGKMELERIPFDISDVFKLCRLISSPKAREKGLTLFCYAEPSVGRLLIGDPTRLRQILLNLLSNAIKFTNNGMVKLLSAISSSTPTSITMHFEVKDSGIGMTSDELSRIYQPFMQADGSTTRKYGGTGLGLTITKSFVELMGGKLEVESSHGLGSKFSFDLTFDTIESDESKSKIDISANSDEKPIFNGEILVCEDNVLNQMVIIDHLSRIGLKAFIAVNGKIGVETIKSRKEKGEKQFDLIFMDIHMPEMDGLEATTRILEMGIKIPIVALTANIMVNDRESYLEVGMSDCLPKPFVAHELWNCLLKFLKPVSMLAIKSHSDSIGEDENRIELITAFVKSNKTTHNDIMNAIESGNLKIAHRLTHTLKGVAGIVGMHGLVQAAFIVEQSLSANKLDSINEQMDLLEKELNSALNELTPIAEISNRGAASKDANDTVFDKENALELLDELDLLLTSDSFDSLNFVKSIHRIPGTSLLINQVDNMKFKQARETLAIIKKQIIEEIGSYNTEKKDA